MKIAFFEVSGPDRKIFENLLSGDDALFFTDKFPDMVPDDIKDVEILCVFVNSKLDKGSIDQMPNLKFVVTRSTGFDHIDTAYCAEKGIKVANVPAYGSHTVAEFTFALLLNLSRKIYFAYNNLREGTNFDISSLAGFDLYGKTIGIIGTGKIGKNVAKIAKGFGMNVQAFDLHPDLSFAREQGFKYKNFEEVLSSSDILTLHTPCSPANYHLIGKEKVAKMKRGVLLINTARGELVDTSALVWGLKEGIIAGAGLDVLEGERELKEEFEILSDASRSEKVADYKTLLLDHMLIDMPNVVVTPHIAFFSKEAVKNIIDTTVENIRAFIAGKPVNLVS